MRFSPSAVEFYKCCGRRSKSAPVESQDYDYKHFPSLKCNVSHKSLRAHYYFSALSLSPALCFFVAAVPRNSPLHDFLIYMFPNFFRATSNGNCVRARCLGCFLLKWMLTDLMCWVTNENIIIFFSRALSWEKEAREEREKVRSILLDWREKNATCHFAKPLPLLFKRKPSRWTLFSAHLDNNNSRVRARRFSEK